MKLNLFFLITILFFISSTVIIVNAQEVVELQFGDTRECVYISQGEEDWYRFHVIIYEGVTIYVCVNPEPRLDVDIYLYNSSGYELGHSLHGPGEQDCVSVTGPYNDYIYIQVYAYSGSGYYNLNTDGEASEPSCTYQQTTTTTTTTPNPTTSTSTTNACPAGCNPPFPCSCPIFGWDPCAALASIYCAFVSFGQTIQGFFQSIIDAIQGFVNGVIHTFTSIGEGIASFFQNLANGIMNGLRTIGEFLASIPRGIINGLRAFVDGIANALGSLFDTIGQNQIAQWIRDNGFITLGVILILIGIVIRPAAWVGALMVFLGLMQHGFRIEYLFIFAGLILLVIIAKR